MVEQPTRCRHDDVHALAQRADLRIDGDAAEDHGGSHVDVLAVSAHAFLDLGSQFAGGRKNQHADRPLAAGRRLRQPVQDRQHEAGRLASAGLCAGEQIAAFEHGRNRLFLDRGRLGIADIGDRTHERVGQAETCERHWKPLLGSRSAGRVDAGRPQDTFIDQPTAERGIGLRAARRVGAQDPRQD